MNFRFFLLLSAFVLTEIFACPPAPAAGGAAATTTAKPSSRRNRRSVESVRLTLVTNADFDPSTNEVVYQQVKSIFREFAKGQNIKYDKSQFVETVRNNAGKLAIEYSGNLDCDEVKHCESRSRSRRSPLFF